MSKVKQIRRLTANQDGFGIIELTVVIIILGMVIGIAYGVILLNARTFKELSDTIATRWEMRKTMDVLRADLQEIDAEKIFGLAKGKNSGKKLFFTNPKGQKIGYIWMNHSLRRKAGPGGFRVLLTNVIDPPFQFLDRSMNPVKAKNKIAYIKVHLSVLSGNKTVKLDDIFYLRNTAPPTP